MNEPKPSIPPDDELKLRLQRAVEAQPVPTHLEGRIREAIRGQGQKKVWTMTAGWGWLGAGLSAGALAVLAFVFVFSRTNPQGSGAIAEAPDQFIARVCARAGTMMRIGLGDHIHCALFEERGKPPETIEQMRQELGPRYAALLPAVEARLSPGAHFQTAHLCTYDGREFLHLVVLEQNKVISLIVTSRKEGETLRADRLVPALSEAGIDFYAQNVAPFQVAAYESPRQMVFVVSDLPAERNTQLLAALAPDVNRVLAAN